MFNNSAIVQGARQANKFINSCALCGQCEVLCPNSFSMADMCLDARRQMVREKRMPPSAHWFALEEMRSARSEGALLAHGPGQDKSAVLFFPGCQLAGIRSTVDKSNITVYGTGKANPEAGDYGTVTATLNGITFASCR